MSIFNKLHIFKPIIAQCHQGQQKNGVGKGGAHLYERIFLIKTLFEPIVINTNLFNTTDGYKQLYNCCSSFDYPIVLGGDHSIGTATVLASVKKYPNLSVIWIDAHADINTIGASITKNRHGTPLASCIGLEDVWFNNKIKSILKPEKLFYVGIRDIDDFEKDTIAKHNISVLDTNQMITYIENTTDKIHISFDVDALDPSILDATGTTAPNGLNVLQVRSIISKALELDKLVGLDIVEFNPDLGNYAKSLDSIKDIFT
jgi:arginase